MASIQIKRILLFLTVNLLVNLSLMGQVHFNNSGKIIVVNGTVLSIHGDYRQSSNELNLIDDGAEIVLTGNLFNQGTGTFTDGASGTLKIDADSIHSISNPVKVRNLTVDLAFPSDTLLTIGSIEVADEITLISGYLNVQKDSLRLTRQTILGDTKGTLENEEENRQFLATEGSGAAHASDDYFYTSQEITSPINKGNLGFSVTQEGGSGGLVSVTRYHAKPTSLSAGNINRSYLFETTNNVTEGTVTFSYFENELGALATNEENLQLFHSTDGGANWEILPTNLNTSAHLAVSDIVPNVNGLWTLSICETPEIVIAPEAPTCKDSTVPLSTTITPAGTYSYEWYANDIPIEGQTNAEINFDLLDESVELALKLTMDNGCSITQSYTLNPISPDLNLDASLTKCPEVSTSIDAGATYTSYQWTNESNQVVGTTQQIDVLLSGDYTLRVTDQDGCAASDLITIMNFPEANLSHFSEKVRTCDASTLLGSQLAIDNPGSTFMWTDDQGVSTTGSTLLVTVDGNYYLEIMSPDNCITQAAANVVLNTTDFADLGNDISIACDAINLNSGVGGASYLWSNGATTPSIPVTESGSYWVEIEVSPVCIDRDTIQVELLPPADSAFFLSATNGFVNDPLYFISLITAPTQTLLWDFDDGNTLLDEPFPSNTYLLEGAYDPSLSVVFENGCASSYSKHIFISEGDPGGRIALIEPVFKEVRVFPNPNDGRFFIEVKLSEASPLQIKLVEVTKSQLIDSIEFEETKAYYAKKFDYNYLNSGAYQLILQSRGEIKTFRMIVAK